jgi:DNA polymerase-3 subunit beta
LGAATLPAHTVAEWVKSLPDAPLGARLTRRTNSVDLICGRMRSTLKGLPASDFPNLPAMEAASATLCAFDLRQAIEAVIFAAAEDRARPILNGVWLQLEMTRLTLAASDGFRVAERTLLLNQAISEATSAVVAVRALRELAFGLRLLEADTPVRLGLEPDGTQIWFDVGADKFGVAFASQTVNGSFPDYRRIVPTEDAHTTRLHFECVEFHAALQSADVIARDNHHALQLTLNSGSATLSALAAETGENVIELPATLEGEPLVVSFNSRYLREAIEALDTPQGTLDLTTPTSPSVIRPVGHTGQLCLLMPMSNHV